MLGIRSDMFLRLFYALAALGLLAHASPVVVLDKSLVSGNDEGATYQFLGIPYALPPIGDLRFRLPQPVPPYEGIRNAASFGPSCPQQAIQVPFISGLPQQVVDLLVNTYMALTMPQSEDCLTLNVFKPSGSTNHARLPVLVWFPGGGFEAGGSLQIGGAVFIPDSGSQLIVVTANYRLSALGFLAGKEVADAGVGNLGLQDQREVLRWVRKYIGAFGGDPDKVTIGGDSAGAISVALHMVANNGNHENLFRGAVMQSGAPIPVGDIANGQPYYDQIVANTGCSGAADTLACLRTVPFPALKAAIDRTPGILAYQSLHLAWLPRADGIFLTDNPQRLVEEGKIARVPFITGNCDDEGTLFSFSTLNITNDAQFRQYIQEIWAPGISDDQLNELARLYPDDIQQGSPFDTSILNAITPQFKRIAAFQGDVVFQAPRRWFLRHTSGRQPSWVYLSKRLKLLPVLGSAHSTDANPSVAGDLVKYISRFATTLDPNDNSISGIFSFKWPQYTTESPNQMVMNDGIIPLTLGHDTYRGEAMIFLTNLTLANPV